MSLLVRFHRSVTLHPVPRLLTLLCLALGLSLFATAPAQAACPASFPVTVPASDTARLIEVIGCANATAGNDVINLTNSTYTLTAVHSSITGLPPIVTTATGGTLTINGNGATIARSSAGGTPAFRIMLINSSANVTLNQMTLTNGSSGASGGAILTSSGRRLRAGGRLDHRQQREQCRGHLQRRRHCHPAREPDRQQYVIELRGRHRQRGRDAARDQQYHQRQHRQRHGEQQRRRRNRQLWQRARDVVL
ncbi:MAG: hypothetical protein IPK19_15985 [Chloroflexi bacterium]|nr:hypothetical protein [Chloroflexota bacterium]